MELDYKIILENNIKGKIIDTKSGASGAVYIVDNGENVIPRKVAFKSIRVDKLDKNKKEYFLHECDLWFKKSNSYLVKAFYPLIIDDLPFICMPYFESDLKSFMLQNDFTEIEALVLATQISKALMEMQNIGIKYHQDFNPPNILLENLKEKSTGYPTNNCLNYSIKIADLGIADLIERIGPTKGGGGSKFPFKAPEQYDTKKYEYYSPDIFALGVIVYMLFTGRHPNGLGKEKALNKNTSSAKFEKWAYEASIELENKNIQAIINRALQANPLNRPNAEEFYNVLMTGVSSCDLNTYDNLKLRFDYFDSIEQLNFLSKEIDILKNISELPHNIEPIKNNVTNILQNLFSEIQSEQDVIRFGEYYLLLIDLSKHNNDKDFIEEISIKLIEILSNWHSKIKVNHKYPSFEFRGEIVLKSPDYRDIEIVSNYIVVIYQVLSRNMDLINIEKLFNKYNDKVFYSIFLYSKALLIRNSDIYKCIEFLNSAKQQFKNEPLFDYMQYLWITHYLINNDDSGLEIIKNKTYKELKENHLYWKTIEKL